MMKLWLPVITLLFTPPKSALRCERPACRCVSADVAGKSSLQFVQAQRDRAERVVVGRVLRVDTLPKVSWGAGDDRVTLRPIVAHMRVRQVWRGPLVDTMTVMVTTAESHSSCDLELRPGTDYLVFAARTEGGPLATRQCSGTEEQRTATATIAALGPGQRMRP